MVIKDCIMSSIRALVVDDSILTRQVIQAILSTDGQIQIVGEASNGREAVRKVTACAPDVVIMDIEMPVMNGFEAIEEIMAQHPVPILVVSSMDDAKTAFRAISLGALEVMSKSEIDVERPDILICKVKYLAGVKVISHIRKWGKGKEAAPRPRPAMAGLRPSRIIVVAASTGGPKALSVIIPALPADFPWPIVIAQHMAGGFASGMADWLSKISRLPVKVVDEKEDVVPGMIYLSPSEKHLTLGRDNRTILVDPRPDDIYHPSCDALLSSVAAVHGSRTIGVILTGMGSDGAEGMKNIKAAGGFTIAQDRASSVVFGMPKVAIEKNCIDKVLPLNEIAGAIIHMVSKARAGVQPVFGRSGSQS
jgi:two-component system chemotaxis response regulator CheB